eukprot:TRINITY_DN9413_c0_g2_i1.p4 TRINITY_DN9413_c0_g2~~TRINITY_DN9413_c0_g2_i1.p4  ORF type:complete len:103 (+),score=17.96 TRINITY_DN9413_c0_g2_i1:1432-1740(+)
MFLVIAFSCMVVGLCIFHSFLLSTEQTTREVIGNAEYLHGIPKDFMPFDKGFIENIRSLCLRRWGKKKTDPYEPQFYTLPTNVDPIEERPFNIWANKYYHCF